MNARVRLKRFSDYDILPRIYVILTPFRPGASITRYEK